MKFKNNSTIFILFISSLFLNAHCNKNSNGGTTPLPPPPTAVNEVDVWITKADQTALLQKKTTSIAFSSISNIYPTINVDSTQQYQTIEGFGYTLTGGSATLLNKWTRLQKAPC